MNDDILPFLDTAEDASREQLVSCARWAAEEIRELRAAVAAARAEAALTKIARLGQDFDAAEPLTEYERKVAQMREDFPNGI